MRIAITTLGCKVNQSESLSIEGTLRENGHEIVSFTENLGTSRFRPDVCIINTCTVTAKSDYQSRQMIRRAVRSGARVFATGCYAQLKPEEISKIKGLDYIIGNSQKNKIYEYIDGLSQEGRKPVEESTPSILVNSPETPFKLGSYYSNRARAFLKIQDGCNFSCAYCTVPMARGKSRSLDPDDVLKAVEKFSAEDYKEIVLTGIHIGCYGLELQPKSSLLKIVQKITEKYPVKGRGPHGTLRPDVRIRLSSIEPHEFKKDFLLLIKQKNVCPHIHIPLQSGSDKILNAMGRGYSTSFFRNLINEIIKECPDISIGTDIIVGFPGESEKDFEETKRLLEELPLSYVHVFPYSKRPDTRAETLPGHIQNEIKKGRVTKILEIAKIKKKAYMTKQLGQRLDVIVEKRHVTDSFYRAISENYIRLLVKAESLILGQRLWVEAVYLSGEELICRPL